MVPYTYKKRGIFYYNRMVPSDLDDHYGSRSPKNVIKLTNHNNNTDPWVQLYVKGHIAVCYQFGFD